MGNTEPLEPFTYEGKLTARAIVLKEAYEAVWHAESLSDAQEQLAILFTDEVTK